jgi:hypothetical protein
MKNMLENLKVALATPLLAPLAVIMVGSLLLASLALINALFS